MSAVAGSPHRILLQRGVDWQMDIDAPFRKLKFFDPSILM